MESGKEYLQGDNTRTGFKLSLLTLALLALITLPTTFAAPTWQNNPRAFEHGILLEIDGRYYYFAGPGSTPGVVDVPGHTWNQAGPDQVVGRHYNVGPNMAPSWWATQEEDGILLFQVHGIIDVPPEELSEEQAEKLKKQGYVHYHELIDAETGEEYEDYVVYLKHTAVRRFDFDGGPRPDLGHEVRPGIDYEFMPNW